MGSSGITDLALPDQGDAPVPKGGDGLSSGDDDVEDQLMPVFRGCRVTTQKAVRRACLRGRVMGHAPGNILVLDAKGESLVR